MSPSTSRESHPDVPSATLGESVLQGIGDELADDDTDCRCVARLDDHRIALRDELDLVGAGLGGLDIREHRFEEFGRIGGFEVGAQTQPAMARSDGMHAALRRLERTLHLVRLRSRHLQAEQRRHRRQRIADAVVGVLQQRLDPFALAFGVSPRLLGLRRSLADQLFQFLVLHLQQPAGPGQRRHLRLGPGEERVGQRRGPGERREDRAHEPLPVALDA